MNTLPYFSCDNEVLNRAYRLAVACVAANTISIKAGVLETESPCVMAGMDYVAPWTRDAAINVFNANQELKIREIRAAAMRPKI